jgi:hypothetical protein
MLEDNKSWIDEELVNCKFKDRRLKTRFVKLMKNLADSIGKPIPVACQDWASIKGAYRFLSNDNVDEHELMEGHFCSTKSRFNQTSKKILVLHDTSEFSYNHRKNDIGITHSVELNTKDGRTKKHYVCGVLMHASLAITLEGVPLGLTAVKFWTRKFFKGADQLKKLINPTRVPIEEKESYRWIENLKNSTELLGDADRLIHVGDRESDMYEFFHEAQRLGSHFLVRMCVDRKKANSNTTILKEMKEVRTKRNFKVSFRDNDGSLLTTKLEVKYKRIVLQPPEGKRKRYPDIKTTVITAQEIGDRKGKRDKINWRLVTDLPITSYEDAIEKLKWYALRWKIEVYFNILKSGCKAEETKLRTAPRVAKLVSVYCILSWRIFWMTMINREIIHSPPQIGFTDLEMEILDHLLPDKVSRIKKKKTLNTYIVKLAQLGGYLARTNDPPPGNKVMWRGMSKLSDIQIGVEIGMKIVGN